MISITLLDDEAVAIINALNQYRETNDSALVRILMRRVERKVERENKRRGILARK